MNLRNRFDVWERQIRISSVTVHKRGHGFLIFEIETGQKYPVIFGYTGQDVLVAASEDTFKDSYDRDAMPSVVTFPRRCHGWDVVHEYTGRYTLLVALYKPRRRYIIGWLPEKEKVKEEA